MIRIHRCLCVLLIGAGMALHAADSPTNEEWQPVVQAIAAGETDAEAKIQGLVNRYPRWADGWTELARMQLEAGQSAAAFASAQKAMALSPTHGEATPLAMQALIQLKRPTEAEALAAPFADKALDRQRNGRAGWVNYYAAAAALAIPDLGKAEAHLGLAKTFAGGAVPGDFHALDARLAVRRGDLVQAEASLIRATTVSPRLWDAWYELGRVRSVLAEREKDPSQQAVRYEAAAQSFATIVKALPDDYESLLGLGRCQLELGKRELDAENEHGRALLQDAAANLEQAIARKDDLVAAHLLLGEALVRLEKYEHAIVALERARALGSQDNGMLYNLALALEKIGKADAAKAIHATTSAVSAPELIGKGMTLAKASMHAPAIEHLGRSVELLDDARDRELKGQVLRTLGHVWLAWATDTRAPPSDSERARRLDSAAEAYARAAKLGDWSAKQHYASMQSSRDPRLGYEAGWQLLRWSTFTSPLGWKLALGNYGACRAWDNPLHYVLWSLLGGVPALLWMITLFGSRRRRSKAAPTSERRPTARAPERRATARRPSDEDSSVRASSASSGEHKTSPALVRKKAASSSHHAPPSPVVRTPHPSLPASQRTPAPETDAQRSAQPRRGSMPETEEIDPPPGGDRRPPGRR